MTRRALLESILAALTFEGRPREAVDSLDTAQIAEVRRLVEAEIGVDEREDLDEGRPDFAGFAQALRVEADWQDGLHTGQHGQPRADGDVLALLRLAGDVERLGDRLGFITRNAPVTP